MKNILITGGAGFIGSNLSIKLKEEGYNVTVLDNLSTQIHGKDGLENSYLYLNIKNKVNFILGSINSKDDIRRALENQDAIIHLAAETGTGQSMYEIEKYVTTNIGGTATLLDILANEKHSIKKIIVASSRSIYGEGKYICNDTKEVVYPNPRLEIDLIKGNYEVQYKTCLNGLTAVATDEESKLHPTSVYGITKLNQEQLVMTVCSSLGIVPISLRLQNIFGPGQSLKNPYTGILSIFSTLILNKKDINIFEDGLESRDFVYIDDVISAFILCLKSSISNPQTYNVGLGKPTSVLEVAKELVTNFNSDVKIYISGNFRLGDIRHNFADTRKIQELLSFKPRYDFKEGIKKFTQWVNSQRIETSDFDLSITAMKERGLLK